MPSMTRASVATTSICLCLAAFGGACGDSSAAGGASAGGGPGTGGSAPAGALVINEIQARGDEWVEIANGSDGDIDLSGFGLCDEDADGQCETASAMRFPDGTVIGPGEYLVVLADQMDPDPGPHDVCIPGVTSCFYATWRVSAADGEVIRLIGADDAEVAQLLYPANATVDATTSWSRLPDMTGAADVGAPTPGAANMP